MNTKLILGLLLVNQIFSFGGFVKFSSSGSGLGGDWKAYKAADTSTESTVSSESTESED